MRDHIKNRRCLVGASSIAILKIRTDDGLSGGMEGYVCRVTYGVYYTTMLFEHVNRLFTGEFSWDHSPMSGHSPPL